MSIGSRGVALGAALLLSAGCGGGRAAVHGDPPRGAAGRPPAAVREVRLATAEGTRLPRTVTVAGTLAADEQVALGLKVAGRLERMAVDLGSRVRRGALLARLAPADFELRVAQAANALEQARVRLGLAPADSDTAADLERTAGVRQADALLLQAKTTRDREASLFAQQLVSRQDLDAAEANLAVAEARRQDAVEEARNRQAIVAQRRAELEIARQQLADSTLLAPFDGVVRERRAAAGDYVAVGQPLVVLVKIDPLRLRLSIPEREAAGVAAGQPVALTVEGDPARHRGRVARLSPAISEDSRTLLVEAEVPNGDGALRPGAFARAEIVVEAATPAVLVPASSVVTFAGVDKVIGVDGGRARERPVKTGRRAGDRVEILAGVAPGEPVVVEPGNLVSGEPVRVAP
jgi:RND family efflux transporter MFP subunit